MQMKIHSVYGYKRMFVGKIRLFMLWSRVAMYMYVIVLYEWSKLQIQLHTHTHSRRQTDIQMDVPRYTNKWRKRERMRKTRLRSLVMNQARLLSILFSVVCVYWYRGICISYQRGTYACMYVVFVYKRKRISKSIGRWRIHKAYDWISTVCILARNSSLFTVVGDTPLYPVHNRFRRFIIIISFHFTKFRFLFFGLLFFNDFFFAFALFLKLSLVAK